MMMRSPVGVVARVSSTLGLALCAGLASSSALATNIIWDGGISGTFQDATNWVGDQLPTFGDTVIFRTSPFMDITFDDTVITGRLLHNEGDLILNLNGHDLDLRVASGVTESWTSGVGVADGGDVHIEAGRVICNFAGIAAGSGERSHLILDDPAAIFESRESSRVGAFGPGSIALSNQASLVVGNDLVIGETAFGDGVITLVDVGTTATIDDQIQVGAIGDGILRVNPGAVATCVDMFISAFETSTGDVFITGEGARLDCSGAAAVGFENAGLLEINQGGVLSAFQFRVGFNPLSSGIVRVQGEGSLLDIATDAAVGSAGIGEMLIRNGARADLGELSITSAQEMAMVRVENPTSRLDIRDELRVGSVGAGLLEIFDGAAVTADDTVINPGGLIDMDNADFTFTSLTVTNPGVGGGGARGGGILETGLRGNGILTGDVINRGIIAPGPDFTTIPLTGSLTFEQTSVFDLDFRARAVGEPMSDGMTVTGDVVLGGTLRMTRDGTLNPDFLQSFPIISAAASISGRFDDAEIDQPSVTELRFIIVSGATDVNIVATIVGDVTGDGSVDSADLANLLASWGTSEPNSDFNDDGVINADDLAVMLAAWGS